MKVIHQLIFLDEYGSIPYFKVEQLNNSNKYQINTPYKTKNNQKLIPPKSIIFPKRVSLY